MRPYLFAIPLPWGRAFRVPSYGLMILLGLLLCLWLAQRRARRMGLDPLAVFDTLIIAFLGGLVGARFFYVVHHWSQFADEVWRVVFLWEGGLAFYGGLIGGAAGLLGALRKKKLPLRATLGVVCSLIPLGHAFGRMGCFLNGCCSGKITDSWLGMRFPRVLIDGASLNPLLNLDGQRISSPVFAEQVAYGWPVEVFDRVRESFSAGFFQEFREATVLMGDRYLLHNTREWSLPVHPTQLYAVGYNLIIFGILSLLLLRRRRAGEIAWLYAILYGTGRFVNEFFRINEPLPALGGLTIFHVMSAGTVILGLVLLLDSRRRPREPLPEPWQPPDRPETVP